MTMTMTTKTYEIVDNDDDNDNDNYHHPLTSLSSIILIDSWYLYGMVWYGIIVQKLGWVDICYCAWPRRVVGGGDKQTNKH